MEKLNVLVTGGNLVVVIFVAAAGFVGWLGTLTWRLSATLALLSSQLGHNQDQVGGLQRQISDFRTEVKNDFKELRKDVTEINTRLSRVEGHLGLTKEPAKQN